jgi:hypothetical protein
MSNKKIRFDELKMGDRFDLEGSKGWTKIYPTQVANYGWVNAQGPPQYLHDLGYRAFYPDQMVFPAAPTRQSVVRDAQHLIDLVEKLAADMDAVGAVWEKKGDVCLALDDVVTDLSGVTG